MKKILSILLVVCIIFATAVAFGAQATLLNVQRSIYDSASVQLISGTTGTTAAYTTNYATFDYPMNHLACDLVSAATSTTAAVTFAVYGNQGTSTTLFDATPTLITSSSLTPSVSASVMKSVNSASGVASPFRTISAIITSPVTTTSFTLTCTATK